MKMEGLQFEQLQRSENGQGTTAARRESDEIESEEDKRRREEDESLELARRLMAEEALASYHHSVQMLRECSDQFSKEDFEALEAALREEAEQQQREEQEEANAAYGEDEEGNLSYEAMLSLGERIGDVKTERWMLFEAQKHINRLPIEKCSLTKLMSQSSADDSEHKCLVCQHEYVPNEELRRLPACGHVFHRSCVDQWLLRTDLCPYCRTSIRNEC